MVITSPSRSGRNGENFHLYDLQLFMFVVKFKHKTKFTIDQMMDM